MTDAPFPSLPGDASPHFVTPFKAMNCRYGKHGLCSDDKCGCACHTEIDVPDECECPGYPCKHVPEPKITTNAPHVAYTRPVTMAMADELDQAGLWAVAEIARQYAVDRPRWWHRFTGGPR